MKPTWKTRFISLLKITGMIVMLFIIAAVIIFSVWQASFVSWTGFGDFITPTGEFIRGKTVWDWMELLVIPLTLLIGGYILNRSERAVERQIAENRVKEDRQLANARAEIEREIATDHQRETALQAYLDRMAELLIDNKLMTTENKEVRNVATIRTLTVLRGLDGVRKGMVIAFLREAKLIERDNPVVKLDGADLHEVILDYAILVNANFWGTDFEKASLKGAYLEGSEFSYSKLNRASICDAFLKGANFEQVTLFEANLEKTDLEGVNLKKAFLRNANLTKANLAKTDLTEANLIGANLTSANLLGAIVLGEQLATAKSLKGATMPNGTIHE